MSCCKNRTPIRPAAGTALRGPSHENPPRDAGQRRGRPALRSLCFALAAAVTFHLFYLGAQPFAAGLTPPPWDKLAHVLVYSMLTVLLWTGTEGRMPLAVIAAVTLIGGLDELHQASLPGRFADAADLFVDAGAAVGTTAVLMMLRARRSAGSAAGPPL